MTHRLLHAHHWRLWCLTISRHYVFEWVTSLRHRCCLILCGSDWGGRHRHRLESIGGLLDLRRREHVTTHAQELIHGVAAVLLRRRLLPGLHGLLRLLLLLELLLLLRLLLLHLLLGLCSGGPALKSCPIAPVSISCGLLDGCVILRDRGRRWLTETEQVKRLD